MSLFRKFVRWLFGKEISPPDEWEDLDGPDGPHGRPTI